MKPFTDYKKEVYRLFYLYTSFTLHYITLFTLMNSQLLFFAIKSNMNPVINFAWLSPFSLHIFPNSSAISFFTLNDFEMYPAFFCHLSVDFVCWFGSPIGTVSLLDFFLILLYNSFKQRAVGRMFRYPPPVVFFYCLVFNQLF